MTTTQPRSTSTRGPCSPATGRALLVRSTRRHADPTMRPGGRLIVGNFHPRNVTKALMDHVLDWRLVHRTEEDLDRLFQASAFGRPTTRVMYEPESINLFAERVKD
ncbi:hypothetical protein [Micromonospora sp. IBHARD004]|uniref:hypothetical protein n=1 Tax=Micromonospora sp. IBHARD004 TaxID=3457764 RepID=UPI0040585413